MRSVVLSAVIILSGCQDYDIRANSPAPGAGPDIEVTPTALSFGPARTGEEVIQSFLVRNVGTEALDVSNVEISVGDIAFAVASDTTFELLPDEERSVDVAFVPVGNLTYGEVLVTSDDPDEGEVSVSLEGLGEVPALTITPESYTFPSICPEQVVLTLENSGLADLQITDLRYDTANPDLSLAHQLTLPLVLSPAESVEVTVRYEPSGSASAGLGQLQVDSNDPRGTRTADQQSEASGDLVSEIFEVLDNPPADILFAIDKSGSMSEEAWNLGRAFDDFITDIG
ncbi:MAG TPA: choice-of-anchor D domain-containing protein, partial [Deltaproteobacteria bacterium]|nr:choice-of-anchor D domain-containing protein [Deltaproteobacteria bacterium]